MADVSVSNDEEVHECVFMLYVGRNVCFWVDVMFFVCVCVWGVVRILLDDF